MATDRLPPGAQYAPAVVIRRVDGVLHQDVDGIVVLVTAAGDQLIDLNPAGSVAWLAIGDGADPDELVAAVRSTFPDAPPEAVTVDVATFLDELHAAGLIER